MTEKTNIDDIIGIVKTEEKTDSVELKKEYYKSRMTENKRYYLGNGKLLTVCDSNKGGSDGFNGLTQYEVVDLLNEQEEELKILRRDKLELEKILSFNDEYSLSGKWNKNLGIKGIRKGDNHILTPTMVVNRLNDLSKLNKRLNERNQRQYNRLKEITDLMLKRDWKTLENMVEDWEKQEKLLEQEWGTYCGDKE